MVCALAACAVLVRPAPAQSAWESTVAEADRAAAARDFDRAEELLTEAVEQSRAFAQDDQRRPKALVSLARLYRAEGDYARPEELYREASEAGMSAWGADSAEYARLLNEIGRYYHTRRKYDIAERFYLDAFSIRAKVFGQEHAEVADSINNLAILFENQARYPKSEIYYQTALDIREKVLGEDHIRTTETREHFARLLLRMQKGDQTPALLEKAKEVRAPILRAAEEERVDLGRVVSGGAGIDPPELVERTEPEYTEEARIARHEGVSSIEVEIDADGTPRNARVVRQLGLGLDEKALEAVSRWRFRPARENGKKVAFRAVLEIRFRLL